MVILQACAEYFAEYGTKVRELSERFPLEGLPLVGESAQKAFVTLLGAILRLRNVLDSFDDFIGADLLTDGQLQDYTSHYLDLHAEFRKVSEGEKDGINDDVVFEIGGIRNSCGSDEPTGGRVEVISAADRCSFSGCATRTYTPRSLVCHSRGK